MENIKKRFKSMYKTSILFSLILFIIGLFLVIKSETTLFAISYFVGIILIIWGIVPVIGYFTNKETQSYLDFSFIIGIFALIFGIIVIINPSIIGSIIPLLVGIWMFINGITKLQYAIMLKKYNTNSTSALVISIIILLCGLTLIFNPFKGAVVLTKLIGIFVIVYSLLDLVECHTLKKTVKDIDNTKEDNNFKESKKTKKNKKKVNIIVSTIFTKKEEVQKLTQLQLLMLSKLARLEGEN